MIVGIIKMLLTEHPNPSANPRNKEFLFVSCSTKFKANKIQSKEKATTNPSEVIAEVVLIMLPESAVNMPAIKAQFLDINREEILKTKIVIAMPVTSDIILGAKYTLRINQTGSA